MWLLNKNLRIAFSNKTEYDDTKQLQKHTKHTKHTGEDYIIHELGRMEENVETGVGVVPCVGTGHRILLLSFALLFL